MREGITGRQLEFLCYIARYTAEQGYAPSLREFCQTFGVNSTNAINDVLKRLESKGMIIRSHMRSRAIVLTDAARFVVGAQDDGLSELAKIASDTANEQPDCRIAAKLAGWLWELQRRRMGEAKA